MPFDILVPSLDHPGSEMTFLPIVQRELRVAARRPGTYWMRMLIALLASCIGAGILLATLGAVSPQRTGQFIFRGLSGLLLLYGLGYGRRATADCLSSEKREGTLGLLFLTDLKGYDVVLGKLTATSVGGFYALLAVMPVLAVCLLLGGITTGEFWRMVLVLVDTFLLSLAIGVLGSAMTRDFRRAMAANFLLLLLLMGALPAAALAIAYFLPLIGFLPELFFCCPVYGFYLSFDAPYKVESAHYWTSVAVIQALTWLLVLLASSIVPRSWQDLPVRTSSNRWRELWHAWSYGKASQRQAYRRQLLDSNAFYWLAARARLKPVHVWTFLGCMAVWWLAGWAASGHYWLDEIEYVLTAGLLIFALKVWVTIEAGQELADDQRSGAVELLLSVPLTVDDILRGQMLALRRQFLKPLFVAIGAQILFMWVLYRRASEVRVLAMWLASILMLLLDLATLTWVAMQQALTAKNHNQATIRTLIRVLVLPWALFGLVMAIGNAWSALTQGTNWQPGWEFNLSLWFGFGVGVDLLFGLRAWWQLHHHFRDLALQRFSPPATPEATQTRGKGGRSDAQAEFVQPESPPRRRAAISAEAASSGDSLREVSEGVQESEPARLRQPRASSKRWVWAALAVASICGAVLALSFRNRDPAPITVHLGTAKGPVRVTRVGQGMLIILPDNSLWLWGRTGIGQPASSPEQYGTNRNWIEVSVNGAHCVGLQEDGTLWEWGASAYLWGGAPTQVGVRRDWVSVGAMQGYALAVRRDGTLWAWGQNGAQNFLGLKFSLTNLVQVGSESNWAAVETYWNWMYGLRKDGTLWMWGRPFFYGSGANSVVTYLTPARVCNDTNWLAFNAGWPPQAWTRSGELWDLSYGPPAPDSPAASNCRLALTNSAPGKAVTAFPASPKLYQVRPDGTLWERDEAYGFMGLGQGALNAKWQRVGKRKDWISIWGSGGTALGLTADGTLWTWGLDPGRQIKPDFFTKIRIARARLQSGIGGPGASGFAFGQVPPLQSAPRPLMKFVP